MMARIVKHTYTVRDKKTGKRVSKKTRNWYIEYTDHDGTPRRVPGFRDKALTQQKAAELEREAMRIQAGVMKPSEATAAVRIMSEAIEEYIADLKAKGRGEKHYGMVRSQLRKIAAGCNWNRTIEMEGTAAQAWLTKRMNAGTMAAQTQCHYVATLRAFAQWLIDEGKLPADPFRKLERANVATDRKHRRRALSNFRFVCLLLAVRRSKKSYYGFTGEDRAALYLLAAFTGFRASELASLAHEAVAFGGTPPAARIAADEAKNRKEATIPIPASIARRLAAWLKGKPAGLLWPGKWALQFQAGKLLQKDLREARIPYRVNGRVFDFHALRGQFGTMLARAGVPLQQAQKLLRHSDPRLTANYYTHLELAELGEAVEKMIK